MYNVRHANIYPLFLMNLILQIYIYWSASVKSSVGQGKCSSEIEFHVFSPDSGLDLDRAVNSWKKIL